MHKLHANGKWTKTSTQVAIEGKPFAEGSLRRAYMSHLFVDNKWSAFVCKAAKDKNTPRSLYFKDIEAQVFASVWAKKYNATEPPKKIEFAPCFVLELVERPGRPVCGAEVYIKGQFLKHNNNVGAVCTGGPTEPEAVMDRKTAQAFSHFTFDASKNQILICDIQGVNGIYTDPQIHTLNGQGFGTGNLGTTGIKAFLLRHKCNEVCRLVGLNEIKAKELGTSQIERKHSNMNFTTLSESTRRRQGRASHSRTNSSSRPSSRPPTEREQQQKAEPSRRASAAASIAPRTRTPRQPRQSLRVNMSPPPVDKDLERTLKKSASMPSPDAGKSVMNEADEKLMASILNGL